jgi:hypothetical protein
MLQDGRKLVPQDALLSFKIAAGKDISTPFGK